MTTREKIDLIRELNVSLLTISQLRHCNGILQDEYDLHARIIANVIATLADTETDVIGLLAHN